MPIWSYVIVLYADVETQVEMPMAKGARPEPDKYHTLGQFYDAIKEGMF
jgi:hypothetical protein